MSLLSIRMPTLSPVLEVVIQEHIEEHSKASLLAPLPLLAKHL